ncbi:MAG: alginate lyase family protein [Clostridia bacterium]|nr:alginate lyase family protein [Clostridia bacterium]
MYVTDERFFCEELDRSVPGLEGIDLVFRNQGIEAAEKQFADFVRGFLTPEKYFRIPYYGRENAWAKREEDDFQAAERILTGELCSVGYFTKFPDTKSVKWRENPTANKYCEWTWQLSRHHEWRCLGRCYRETGDERYTQAFIDFFTTWYEQAPCPENAGSGATECWRTIEAGIRLTKNWNYAIHAFYKSPLITDHILTTIFKSVWDHGYRLRNFSTSANWLIMELSGLAHIVMLYPFFVKTPDWKEYAFRRLSEEIDVQVYPDGFQYELSTGYHGTVSGNYNFVINTARAMEYDIPEAVSKNLERTFEMYMKLCRPNGTTPSLNDGGEAGARGACNLGLSYFPYREDFRWFATDGREGTAPDYTSVAMPYSGIASMRTGWGKNDIWFFMESAPFGKGHQHEDKLNVLMFAYGKDVLQDVGNYAYDTSDMRKFVLDTRAHNCAMVDDLDQRRRPKYRWQPEMISMRSDLKWHFTADVDAAEGIYNEGYGSNFIPVTHRRKSIFFKRGLNGSLPFALIIDRLSSDDGTEHKYSVSYQMNVQPYKVEGNTFTADFGDGVTMSVIGDVDPDVVVAQKSPLYMGWRPDHSGLGMDPVEVRNEQDHKPAPCLRYHKYGASKRIATVLYPSNNGEVAIKDVVISEDFEDTAVELVFSDGSHIVLNENDYPCSADSDEKLKN